LKQAFIAAEFSCLIALVHWLWCSFDMTECKLALTPITSQKPIQRSSVVDMDCDSSDEPRKERRPLLLLLDFDQSLGFRQYVYDQDQKKADLTVRTPVYDISDQAVFDVEDFGNKAYSKRVYLRPHILDLFRTLESLMTTTGCKIEVGIYTSMKYENALPIVEQLRGKVLPKAFRRLMLFAREFTIPDTETPHAKPWDTMRCAPRVWESFQDARFSASNTLLVDNEPRKVRQLWCNSLVVSSWKPAVLPPDLVKSSCAALKKDRELLALASRLEELVTCFARSGDVRLALARVQHTETLALMNQTNRALLAQVAWMGAPALLHESKEDAATAARSSTLRSSVSFLEEGFKDLQSQWTAVVAEPCQAVLLAARGASS
jgi:hypothetical protein